MGSRLFAAPSFSHWEPHNNRTAPTVSRFQSFDDIIMDTEHDVGLRWLHSWRVDTLKANSFICFSVRNQPDVHACVHACVSDGKHDGCHESAGRRGFYSSLDTESLSEKKRRMGDTAVQRRYWHFDSSQTLVGLAELALRSCLSLDRCSDEALSQDVGHHRCSEAVVVCLGSPKNVLNNERERRTHWQTVGEAMVAMMRCTQKAPPPPPLQPMSEN